MKLRFNPSSASSHEWDFDPDKTLTLGEASEIEHRCRPLTFEEAKVAAIKGSVEAKLAFLYVFLRRQQPNLKFDTLRDTIAPGEVTLDYDLAEMVKIRAELVRQLDAGTGDEVDVRAGIDLLDKEIAEQGGAPEGEAEVEQPGDPKDEPEISSVTSGGLRSLPSSTSTPATSIA